jgi:hypothetical protein
MLKRLLISACLCLLLQGLSAQTVFVNEFHYDDTGTDTLEGVEIAGPVGTDLDCYQILLYNGADSMVYSTFNLSGTLPDQCNGYGTLWFPMALQNGPDGLALVYNPALAGCSSGGALTVIRFWHYEGSPILALDGAAAGLTSTNTGVTEPTSTPNGNSLQLTGNGTVGSNFTWASPAPNTIGQLNNGQTFGGPCAAVVATQASFSNMPSGCILPNSPFSVSACLTNSSGAVATTYNGPLTISLASGAGVLSGTTTVTATNGCATFNNLSLNATGPFSFSVTDGVISSTSPIIYTSPTCSNCPYMWRALIDACDLLEGSNEVLTFNTGDFFLEVTPSAMPITYGTTTPPATNYTTSLTSNTAYVNTLNTTAGCIPPLFVDALSNSPIPPNTNFMIMRYDPTFAYDFSAFCGQGPYYVVFSTAAAWNTTGNFKNCVDCLGPPFDPGTGLTPRYFRSNFSALTGGAACDYTYTYTPCSSLLCLGNGDGLDWPVGGGAPSSAWNSFNAGCLPLPASYSAALSAEWEGQHARLSWATSSEVNCKSFIVERAVEGDPAFHPVAEVPAQGGLDQTTPYSLLDTPPAGVELRYRLNQVDYNGESRHSNVVRLAPLGKFVWDAAQVDAHTIRLYSSLPVLGGQLLDLQGRQLRSLPAFEQEMTYSTDGLPAGTYVLVLRTQTRTLTKKILVGVE